MWSHHHLRKPSTKSRENTNSADLCPLSTAQYKSAQVFTCFIVNLPIMYLPPVSSKFWRMFLPLNLVLPLKSIFRSKPSIFQYLNIFGYVIKRRKDLEGKCSILKKYYIDSGRNILQLTTLIMWGMIVWIVYMHKYEDSIRYNIHSNKIWWATCFASRNVTLWWSTLSSYCSKKPCDVRK